jgi:hypothetical protein
MKRLLLLLLLFPPLTVLAEGVIVGPNCLITWPANPAIDKVTGYNVYWGTVSNQYGTPVNVTITQAACSTIGITVVGQYYVAISAVNMIGESGKSVEVPFELLGLPGIVIDVVVE